MHFNCFSTYLFMACSESSNMASTLEFLRSKIRGFLLTSSLGDAILNQIILVFFSIPIIYMFLVL